MTLSRFLPSALLFALGSVSLWPASGGDTGNPIAQAIRPHGDRLDRAWKRYRNIDLGYCVSYPSRWAKGEAFNGAGLFVKTGLHRYSKATSEIDIGPLTMPGPEDARLKPARLLDDTLQEDLQEHLAGLRKFERAERMEVIDQHPMNLHGFAALYVKNKYYDPLERSNWMEEVVFVQRNGELFRMEMQCPPDQINRFEPVFAYLVNSLEFDCK